VLNSKTCNSLINETLTHKLNEKVAACSPSDPKNNRVRSQTKKLIGPLFIYGRCIKRRT
jgi:hypothetical protein